MGQIVKILAVAYGIAVTLSGSLVLWVLGGPSETYAIARIDGVDFIPLMPMFGGTCYSAAFTNVEYRHISLGDSPDAVRKRLGEPLRILWVLDDKAMGKFVWFEPDERGDWRSIYVNELDVPNGTSMSSLSQLHAQAVEQQWDYSRSCVPDDSKRVRWVTFRANRLTGRGSGIYYD